MPSIEEDLHAIRTQITTVQSKKARAQVEYENARERAVSAKKTLEQEFGVSTTDSATALQTKLEEELAAAITEAKRQLEAAGA